MVLVMEPGNVPEAWSFWFDCEEAETIEDVCFLSLSPDFL